MAQCHLSLRSVCCAANWYVLILSNTWTCSLTEFVSVLRRHRLLQEKEQHDAQSRRRVLVPQRRVFARSRRSSARQSKHGAVVQHAVSPITFVTWLQHSDHPQLGLRVFLAVLGLARRRRPWFEARSSALLGFVALRSTATVHLDAQHWHDQESPAQRPYDSLNLFCE